MSPITATAAGWFRRGTDPGEDKILQEAEGRAPVLIKKNAVLTGDGVFTWE